MKKMAGLNKTFKIYISENIRYLPVALNVGHWRDGDLFVGTVVMCGEHMLEGQRG